MLTRDAGAAAGRGPHGGLHSARAHAGNGDALGEQPAAVRLCWPPPFWPRPRPSHCLWQPTWFGCAPSLSLSPAADLACLWHLRDSGF
jgi:hypothetical protein